MHKDAECCIRPVSRPGADLIDHLVQCDPFPGGQIVEGFPPGRKLHGADRIRIAVSALVKGITAMFTVNVIQNSFDSDFLKHIILFSKNVPPDHPGHLIHHA